MRSIPVGSITAAGHKLVLAERKHDSLHEARIPAGLLRKLEYGNDESEFEERHPSLTGGIETSSLISPAPALLNCRE